MHPGNDIYDIIFCIIIFVISGTFAINPRWYTYFSLRKIDYEQIPRRKLAIVRFLAGMLTIYSAFCIGYYVVFGKDIFM